MYHEAVESRGESRHTSEAIAREILLAFWKVHILHHAGERPIYGHWLLEELRRHGFRVSPGTLYPMLARMQRNGWLRLATRRGTGASPKSRREFRLTPAGARVLARVRRHVAELHREVVSRKEPI